MLPANLYDAEESARFGLTRVTGYLMRLRVENLVARPDGEFGLRRATHVAAMIEVCANAYASSQPTGFFYKELTDQVAERLRTAHLQSEESRFRDIFAWRDLHRDKIRDELYSNLARLLKDEPTECLMIGVELHVLLEMHMQYRFGNEYLRVTRDIAFEMCPQLMVSQARLEHALSKRAA